MSHAMPPYRPLCFWSNPNTLSTLPGLHTQATLHDPFQNCPTGRTSSPLALTFALNLCTWRSSLPHSYPLAAAMLTTTWAACSPPTRTPHNAQALSNALTLTTLPANLEAPPTPKSSANLRLPLRLSTSPPGLHPLLLQLTTRLPLPPPRLLQPVLPSRTPALHKH